MELTPQKIYEQFNKKVVSKQAAITQLRSLIENSDRLQKRLDSLNILEEIGKDSNKVFHQLESLLISDSYIELRMRAAEIMQKHFLEQSYNPMKWGLQHEEAPECLKIIHETLMKYIKKRAMEGNRETKKFFIKELKNSELKDFRIGFETICEGKLPSSFSIKQLEEYLINYFTLFYLTKSMWRLRYKVENCLVIEIKYPHGNLEQIPSAIKYLTSLKSLKLKYNLIRKIPDWISNLQKLEYLNLNSNFSFITLPESFGDLKSLKQLHLWNNQTRYLPQSFVKLKSLEILKLRINQLEKLPKNVGKLSSLRELDLFDNNLNSLPDSLGKLKSLTMLNLNSNYLEKLPESIGELKNLEYLDISNNELSEIPDSFKELSNIRILDVSRNNLTVLPEDLFNLPNLTDFNFAGNRSTEFPKWTLKLKERGVKIFPETPED